MLDPKLRALRKLEREEPTGGSYVFASERDGPLMAVGFWKPLARAGAESTVDFPVHPHMPRHSCGYKLANDGHNIRAIQHYLGHKNIQHAVSYTELSAERFKGFGGIDPDLTSSMEVACYPPSTRDRPCHTGSGCRQKSVTSQDGSSKLIMGTFGKNAVSGDFSRFHPENNLFLIQN